MPFTCQSCGKVFTTKSHCKDHKLNKHSKPGGRKCTECEKQYRQMNNFVAHFKKEHLNCKTNGCNTQRLCNKCAGLLKNAKKTWLECELRVNRKPKVF